MTNRFSLSPRIQTFVANATTNLATTWQKSSNVARISAYHNSVATTITADLRWNFVGNTYTFCRISSAGAAGDPAFIEFPIPIPTTIPVFDGGVAELELVVAGQSGSAHVNVYGGEYNPYRWSPMLRIFTDVDTNIIGDDNKLAQVLYLSCHNGGSGGTGTTTAFMQYDTSTVASLAKVSSATTGAADIKLFFPPLPAIISANKMRVDVTSIGINGATVPPHAQIVYSNGY